MKAKITKILFALVGLVLIGILVFFYTAFNGNPIKVYLTRGQIKTYLETTYPEVEFTNISSLYNFKYGGYGGRALAHTEPPVQIYINQYQKGVFSDNLVDTMLEAQAKAEIVPLATALFPGKDFSIMLKGGDYPVTTRFSKDLPVELFIDARWSGPKVTVDEYLDEVLAMHEAFKAEGYTVSGYFFSYRFPPGADESYSLSLKGGEIIMTREALKAEMHHFTK